MDRRTLLRLAAASAIPRDQGCDRMPPHGPMRYRIVSDSGRSSAIPGRPDEGKEGSVGPTPPDLYAHLEAIKGPAYLWESYATGLIEAVKKMGCPTHRIKADFVPRRLYHWIETLSSNSAKRILTSRQSIPSTQETCFYRRLGKWD